MTEQPNPDRTLEALGQAVTWFACVGGGACALLQLWRALAR